MTSSLNQRAWNLAQDIAAKADELGGAVLSIGGARVIDLGVKSRGSLGAGLALARLCLADMGTVQLFPGHVGETAIPTVAVIIDQPVAACMASQYAGWQIAVGKYFAMASGPMRAAYGKEDLFDHIGYREAAPVAVGILETGKLPPEEVVTMIAQKCSVSPDRLTLAVARTASLPGSVQIVARSVETALHKLHTLGFDLSRIVSGFGSAPLPPVAKNDLAAIGRTNDAVLYGGAVTLYVTGDDDSLADVGPKLPSSASRDYGKPFAEIFAACNHDFYKIDPLLFSPASICLQNLDTGQSFRFGQTNPAVLQSSFAG